MNTQREIVAFCWSETYRERYCVVVLDPTRTDWVRNDAGERVPRSRTREYRANTVRALREKARRHGYVLSRGVGKRCLQSVHLT